MKMSKLTPKVKEIPNFPIFKDFRHFSNFLTDFVDWNVEKGEQRKILLSSSCYEEFFAFFEMKTSQMDTENDKNPKGFQFSKILGISSSLTDSVDWNVEKGKQGNNLLSSSRYEEFIAFLEMKKSQIDTENDKNPKLFNIQRF